MTDEEINKSWFGTVYNYNGIIIDNGLMSSIDWENRTIINSTNSLSINWNNHSEEELEKIRLENLRNNRDIKIDTILK